MRKAISLIIAVGILVRIFLAFSTFHPDIQPFYFAGSVIAKGNTLNFYDYMASLPSSDPILKVYPTYLFNYPPLVYFFLGPVSFLISSPFSKDLLGSFIFDLPSLLGNINLNVLLLTLKLPYLMFDFGVALLIYKLFEKPSNKFLALTLWIFNPVNLYATYMMGQFDIIPTFLTVLALYLAVKKKKIFLASLFLGFGASFKIFPVLFFVPLALLKDKWIDRSKVIGIGALTYLATILPFISSPGFRSTALVAGQTTKSLYAAIPISGGESIFLFPLFILFAYFVFLFKKGYLAGLWERFFIVILLFFVFTHYHPQWFLWITPFLIFELVRSKFKHWFLIVIALIAWLGQISFFDPGLSVRLFSPINPNLYSQVGIWENLGISYDLNMARSILQTVFASVCLYFVYYYFPRESRS